VVAVFSLEASEEPDGSEIGVVVAILSLEASEGPDGSEIGVVVAILSLEASEEPDGVDIGEKDEGFSFVVDNSDESVVEVSSILIADISFRLKETINKFVKNLPGKKDERINSVIIILIYICHACICFFFILYSFHQLQKIILY
jgi:hypothetical protein